ncbi:response regulator [Desulfopila aestuarii]|uniref:CheY chemotaxis protein or a CheY-like REC (Receiver) domain n=1 Tax=Desulfopila aestuarii DSM 18488 TaxID=1121416 RepID=A0A1M7XVU8_9BACT|nr:response regulator [Desulfopila aestuarii]SHO42805.1 CheY chemotaxis protein or a CheY-like REC (receiver) domain [Desulfopila aestuarii DSM 18488]
MTESCIVSNTVSPSHGVQKNSPGTASGKTVSTRSEEPPRRSLSILIAEDEPISRLFLSRVLAKLGHEVRSAKNGQEVLTILQDNESFDVLLTDIKMPQIDGVELSRILRSSEKYSHRNGLSIIAMTAFARPGDKDVFLKAGMDVYLPKPIDGRLLEIILEKVSGKSQ